MPQRVLVIVAAALCAAWALGGCGGGGDGGSTASRAGSATPVAAEVRALPPATFASLPSGWRAFDRTETELAATGAAAESYATSWVFDPSSGDGPAGDLPRGGAIVEVLLLRRRGGGTADPSLCRGVPPSRAYPPVRRLPLKLDAMGRGTLEGAPRVAQYRVRGTQGEDDYRVEVRVSIAPEGSRAEAQRVLDGLRLPRWGDRC